MFVGVDYLKFSLQAQGRRCGAAEAVIHWCRDYSSFTLHTDCNQKFHYLSSNAGCEGCPRSVQQSPLQSLVHVYHVQPDKGKMHVPIHIVSAVYHLASPCAGPVGPDLAASLEVVELMFTAQASSLLLRVEAQYLVMCQESQST